MKKFVVLMVMVMVLGLVGASVVFAAPYASLNAGTVWVEDSGFSESADGISVNGDISFDTGYGITAALGNTYDSVLRAELEFGYRKSDMDELSGTFSDGETTISGSGSIGGNYTTVSLMANIFYDFMPKSTFSPFIGAGIGYANVNVDIESDTEDDNVFAYQAAAGVAFTLSQQTKLDVQYRYFATSDLDLGGVDFEYASHNAMLGLRFSY